MKNLHDVDRIKDLLKKRVRSLVPSEGRFVTGIKNIMLHRRDSISTPEICMYKPMIIKIIQGNKCTVVADKEYVYGEDDLFITGMTTANNSFIVNATPEKPCIVITIELDYETLADLALQTKPQDERNDNIIADSILVQSADEEILDCFLRLIDALLRPKEKKFLAPLIVKEIYYHLLLGDKGSYLRSFHIHGLPNNQILNVTKWIEQNLTESLSVKELADIANMSDSTFYRRFKEITKLSPLQYQKNLRLYKAQRLMLRDDLPITEASCCVGYASTTQFCREYKRFFGMSPHKHIKKLLTSNLADIEPAEIDRK